jgi:hypothetical protein
VGLPRGESRESEPGTREVRVHAVRLGGRRRLDASRVFSTCRLQGLLVLREGASREEVRSTADARRGWTDGETVRVNAASKRSLLNGPRVSARWFSIRRKALSGFFTSCSHQQGAQESSGSQVNSASASVGRKVSALMKRTAHRADIRIPTRACLRVTKGASEVDTVR